MRSDRRSYPSPSPSRVRVLRARAITAIPYHGLPSAHIGLYAVYGYTVYGICTYYTLAVAFRPSSGCQWSRLTRAPPISGMNANLNPVSVGPG